MNDFRSILIDFDGYLKSINAPVLSTLKSGIDYLETEKIPFELTEDVELLYRWKNGTVSDGKSLGQLWLFNFGFLLSFEEATKVYTSFAGNVVRWDTYKFPLFESGGGEFYLIECNQQVDEFGMIFLHSVGDINFDVLITKYDSLKSFILTVHKCYVDKAYSFSENGLDFDFELECKISRELNPKSEYWNVVSDLLDF